MISYLFLLLLSASALAWDESPELDEPLDEHEPPRERYVAPVGTRFFFAQSSVLAIQSAKQAHAEDYTFCFDDHGFSCFSPGFSIGTDKLRVQLEVDVTRLNEGKVPVFEIPESDGWLKRRAQLHVQRRWQPATVSFFTRTSTAALMDVIGRGAYYGHIGAGAEVALGPRQRHSFAAELGPTLYSRKGWSGYSWYAAGDVHEAEWANLLYDSLRITGPLSEVERFLLLTPSLEYRLNLSERVQLQGTWFSSILWSSFQVGVRFQR